MKRITIDVQNEVGVIARITGILADNDINIRNLNTELMDEDGMVFITTEDEDHDKALWWLADAGFKAMTEETLIISMPDQPGALAKVAEKFRDHNINILSIHIVHRIHGDTFISVSTDDQDKARELFRDQLVSYPDLPRS